MTRALNGPLSALLAVSLAISVLLGVAYCSEREARERATHDAVADSLARDTETATARLVEADTVYVRTDRHYREVRTRVDTVQVSAEVRAAIRACDALQVTCAARSRASDSLVRNLRAELEHALDPPPGPRLSWRLRAGRDLSAGEWEAAGGPRYRIMGPVEAYAEMGTRWTDGESGVRRNEATITVGGEITFGRKRQ